MLHHLICLSILVLGATAVPVVSDLKSTNHTITFEDLKGKTKIFELTPIGTYSDLDYEGIGKSAMLCTLQHTDVTRKGVLRVDHACSGVQTKSPTNAAAYSPDAPALKSSKPRITVGYPGSTVRALDFSFFYFGCELPTAELSASVPVPCSITVKGYNKDLRVVAEQSFSFGGGDHPGASMVKASLSKEFRGLEEVRFETHSAVSEKVATLLDDFVYTTYARVDAA